MRKYKVKEVIELLIADGWVEMKRRKTLWKRLE